MNEITNYAQNNSLIDNKNNTVLSLFFYAAVWARSFLQKRFPT